ncbi:MAG: hypothetical protein HKN21_09105, partial [Candidatus Eisenbacteria bacterium]|nr:hypothetical protein [Candidatus Eisenbacteria bacterium]
ENLRLAFPEKDAAWHLDIYKKMLQNMGGVLSEFARLTDPKRSKELLFELKNAKWIPETHALGRGGFLLSAHFGNWEGMGAIGADMGVPITVLGARQRNPLVEKMFSEYRASLGVEAITVRSGMRPLVQALKQGRLVTTLADQDGGRDGIFLDFFGRKASVQAGVFRLAARLQAPILVGFSTRVDEGWSGYLHPPLMPREAQGPEALEKEATRLAREYTQLVEQAVSAPPAHWFLVHRRWKTRPKNQPETQEKARISGARASAKNLLQPPPQTSDNP